MRHLLLLLVLLPAFLWPVPVRSTVTFQGATLSGTEVHTPPYLAPLKTTVGLTTGSSTPSFTRATSATVFDHRNVMRTVQSGEARFLGARRVENLLDDTEDFSPASWIKSGTASVTGTNTLNFPAATDGVYQIHAVSLLGGSVYVGSAMLSGSGTASLQIYTGGGSFESAISVVTLTSTPTRYAIVYTNVAGDQTSLRLRIVRNTGDTATTVTATDAQLELVTGNADETVPSEYVSEGVESSPFFGAMVDGVRYFDYENSCSVNSNVVSGCGVPGGEVTNSLTYSRDYIAASTDWLDQGTPIVTANAVGIDGVSNTAHEVEDDDAAITEIVYQNVAVLADTNTHTFSAYIKKDSDETRFPEVQGYLSGGAGVNVAQFISVNTATGENTLRQGSGDYGVESYGDWWRVWGNITNNGTETTLQIYLSPARGNTLGGNDVSATGSTIFDGAQVELNASAPGSFVETLDVAVTKREAPMITDIDGYLVEMATTNSLTYSRDYIVASTDWAAAAGTPTVAADSVGIDGVSNTGHTITDDDGASKEAIFNSVTVPNDSNTHAVSVFIKKDSDETRFPELFTQITGGTTQYSVCQINTETGATNVRSDTDANPPATTDTCYSQSWGDWWRLVLTNTNVGDGGTTLDVRLYPAHGSTLGGNDAAATGSTIFDGAQVELNQPFATSFVETVAATVTRNADALTYTPSPVTGEVSIVGTWTPCADESLYGVQDSRLFGTDDSGGANDEIGAVGGTSYSFAFQAGGSYFTRKDSEFSGQTAHTYGVTADQVGANIITNQYLDGVQKKTDESDAGTLDHSDASFGVGYWDPNYGCYAVKDLQIWDRPLSDAQMLRLTQ